MQKWIAAGMVTLVALAFTTSSALAATMPTLNRGARGADVALMQRLLTHGGEPVAITALLGPTTEGLVKRFQAKHGLATDGIVGRGTWAALQPKLRQGDRGVAVEGLQHALNAKGHQKVATDGIFGPQTRAAVAEFQAHMGLAADGIVGPSTWRALTSHFEPLPDRGPGWYRYHTSNRDGNWGSSHMVASVKEVFRRWDALGTGIRLGVGDMSLPHGGSIPGHASHQKGVDVDLRLVRKDGREVSVAYWDPAYSRKLTQKVVDLLHATGDIDVIFFNDPQVKGVRSWPHHEAHMHVRFKR